MSYDERSDGAPLVLEHVRDLEAFDGPLLSELRAIDGAVYVEKWCTCDEGSRVTRTLVVRSSAQRIADYLAGRVTMMTLLTEDRGIGLLCDHGPDGLQRVAPVAIADLPPRYLPSAGAYHDPELAPDENSR